MFNCVSKDGLVYRSESIDDLPQTDSTLCYLRECSEESYTTQYGNTYKWYRYEFVDRNGTSVSFKMGTCEVVFIAKDDASYYLRGRQFTIRDQYGREGIFSIRGDSGDMGDSHLNKIATKLVPFMLKLSAAGGWDAYWSQNYPNLPNAIRWVSD